MEKKHYWFSVPAESNGWLWFVCCQCPYLMKMNIETHEIVLEAKLPVVTDVQSLQEDYVALAKEENKIIMFPHWFGSNILEYDCIKKTFIKFLVPTNIKFNNDSPLFNYICKTEEFIFAIGGRSATIIQYDKKEGKYLFLQDWFSKLGSLKISFEKMIFGKAIVLKNKIYIPYRQGNAIVQVDIESDETEIFSVGNYDNGWCSIAFIEGMFWLLPVNKSMLVCWDIEKNRTREIDLGKYLENSITNEQFGYYIDVVEVNGELYLLPFRGKYLLKYNWKKNRIQIVREEDLFLGIYCGSYENDEKIWSYIRAEAEDRIICISKKSGAIKEIQFDKFEVLRYNEEKIMDNFKLKQTFINN